MLGLGTIESPYIIQTPQDFDNIRNDVDAYYELGNDIDYGNDNFYSIGTSSARFNAKIDGKGFTVSNVKVINGTSYDVGIFGYTNLDFEMHNIKFLNIQNDNTGTTATGTTTHALLFSILMGKVSNVHLEGKLTARNIITRLGAFAGNVYETSDRIELHNIYTKVDIEIINGVRRTATTGLIGGFIGSSANDNVPTISPYIDNILVNNTFKFTGTNTNNLIIGRVMGNRNYETTYPNVYVNTTGSFSNYVENFGILTDATIRQPVNLDSNYWIQGEGEIPELRVFYVESGNQGKRSVDVDFKTISITLERSKSKLGMIDVPFNEIVLNAFRNYKTDIPINFEPIIVDVKVSDKKNVIHILDIPFNHISVNAQKVNKSFKTPSIDFKPISLIVDVFYPVDTTKPIYACVFIQNGCSTAYTITSCNHTQLINNCTKLGVI